MKRIIPLLVGLVCVYGSGVVSAAEISVEAKLAEALRLTEESLNSKTVERILEEISPHFTFEERVKIAIQLRDLTESGLASAKRARQALERGERREASYHLTQAQKYLTLRLELELTIVDGLKDKLREILRKIITEFGVREAGARPTKSSEVRSEYAQKSEAGLADAKLPPPYPKS